MWEAIIYTKNNLQLSTNQLIINFIYLAKILKHFEVSFTSGADEEE